MDKMDLQGFYFLMLRLMDFEGFILNTDLEKFEKS
jgi:hypothetical protein